MPEVAERQTQPRFVDKEMVRRIIREQNERMGFTPDTSLTPQELRERMRSLGVRPEDNLASRGIIAARDEE